MSLASAFQAGINNLKNSGIYRLLTTGSTSGNSVTSGVKNAIASTSGVEYSGSQSGWSSSGGSSSGGSGYGYGYGYSSGPTQKEKDAAANLAAVAQYNANTITNKNKQANEVLDISDKNNEALKNLQIEQTQQKAGDEWYTQQQKLQSATHALTDSMGNAGYSSTLLDFQDMIARKDDMDDVEVLNNARDNANASYLDYWEALARNNDARNENAMNTENELRDIASDYAAQLNNIHPDLAGDIISGGTVNAPSWIDTNYYENNKVEAITPTGQELFRPDSASADAKSSGLIEQTKTRTSATNQSYWDRVKSGYNNRKTQ